MVEFLYARGCHVPFLCIKQPLMRICYALLLTLPLSIHAQTTWEVEVGGSTIGGTPPYYLPADLVIQEGDLVHWEAVSGTHNVYGQLDEFPTNPEGFDSDSAVSNMDFIYTFTIPGFYMYHCTQDGHAVTQHGTITVIGSSGIVPLPPRPLFSLFPVPADDQVMISFDGCRGATSAEVVTSSGRTVRIQEVRDNSVNTIDLAGLSGGQYYMIVHGAYGRSAIKAFVKR